MRERDAIAIVFVVNAIIVLGFILCAWNFNNKRRELDTYAYGFDADGYFVVCNESKCAVYDGINAIVYFDRPDKMQSGMFDIPAVVK